MLALLLLLRVLPAASTSPSAAPVPLRTGDVVLQTSQSGMSEAIRRATSSPYSHVGLVEVTEEGTFVLEAIEPVSRTSWERWRARGKGSKVTVLRTSLGEGSLRAVVEVARAWLGRHYDVRYGWGDEQLYCSELVVKAFERGAGVELGEQQRLDSLKLSPSDRALARKLGVSLAQTVVAPASLVREAKLSVVYSDF